MSWGTCNKATNNIYFDFPPLMNDGRNYANWYTGAVINNNIRKNNNIKSNWDYRQFLMKNSDEIIKVNQINSLKKCECVSKKYTNEKNSKHHNPYIFKSCLDKYKPFGYEDSDLKQLYLSKNELNDRYKTPVLTQEDLLKLRIQK